MATKHTKFNIGDEPTPGVRLRTICRGHESDITRLAWSPDGRFLAAASRDETVRIWEVETGKCRTVLKGHKDSVFCVAWSPEGKTLASGGADNTIRLWEAGGKPITTLTGHKNWVLSVAYSHQHH